MALTPPPLPARAVWGASTASAASEPVVFAYPRPTANDGGSNPPRPALFDQNLLDHDPPRVVLRIPDANAPLAMPVKSRSLLPDLARSNRVFTAVMVLGGAIILLLLGGKRPEPEMAPARHRPIETWKTPRPSGAQLASPSTRAAATTEKNAAAGESTTPDGDGRRLPSPNDETRVAPGPRDFELPDDMHSEDFVAHRERPLPEPSRNESNADRPANAQPANAQPPVARFQGIILKPEVRPSYEQSRPSLH